YLKAKFDHKIGEFSKFSLKTAALEEASHPMVEVVTGAAIAALLYFGGRSVLDGSMTAGDLIGFFTAFALMMDPIRRLNDINIKFNHANVATSRVMEILSWKSNIVETKDPKPITGISRALSFDQVRFVYPDAP